MYGIEVYSKAGLHTELTEQEWSEIKTAIGGWMIENEGGNGNTVYVEAMDADKTVRALNAIGFTTDEDYLVAEDDDDDFANITIEQRGDVVVVTNNSSFGLYDNQDEYSYYFAFDSEDAAGVYNDPLDLDAGESIEYRLSVGDYVKATVWYSSADVGATICDEIDLDPVADDDDPAETPYGYFAACTYGGNSWELYKTPEQDVGVAGDYMRDLRAKVAGIELPENIEWVEVSPIEQGVLIIVGSQFNSLYSPYNEEPMFLKYEPSIVTPETFEVTYPTLAAVSRAAGEWERNEMIRFDHSWRPNIN